MSELLGVLLLVVAVALAAAGTKRMLVANPGTRIPWIGRPAHEPKWSITLTVVAIGSAAAGINLLTDDNIAQMTISWLVGIVALLIPIARHNRRLS